MALMRQSISGCSHGRQTQQIISLLNFTSHIHLPGDAVPKPVHKVVFASQLARLFPDPCNKGQRLYSTATDLSNASRGCLTSSIKSGLFGPVELQPGDVHVWWTSPDEVRIG